MKAIENRGRGRTLALALGGAFLAGVAVLWSWNTLAADLFGLPEMEFRHAAATALAISVVGAVAALPWFARRRDTGQ